MGYLRDLFEAFVEADILVLNKKYKLVRTVHIMEPRGNSKICRDGNLSKSKYEKLMNASFSKLDLSKQFVITWTGVNGKANAITARLEGNRIILITAYMNESKKESSLFKLITNRISVSI